MANVVKGGRVVAGDDTADEALNLLAGNLQDFAHLVLLQKIQNDTAELFWAAIDGVEIPTKLFGSVLMCGLVLKPLSPGGLGCGSVRALHNDTSRHGPARARTHK